MKAIKVALAIIIVLLATWLFLSWLDSKAKERDLLSWINVSVIQVENSIPPGLLVEVNNSGPRVVGRTHFRLVFEANGREFCRVDMDSGNFEPNEKRRILLKCRDTSKNTVYSSLGKVHYLLNVFPEYKKGLGIIEGEFYFNK